MNTHGVRHLTLKGFPAIQYPDGRIRPVVQGGSDPDPQDPPAEQSSGAEGEQPPPSPQQQPVVTIPVDPPPPADPDPDLVFTAKDIEKARKEEKDKLYGRLQTMEEELSSVREEREAREAAEAEAREAAEAEARAAAEEEMSARELIQAKEQEWSQRIAALEQERAEERRIFEMERAFQEVENYRTRAVAASEEEIMPELRDLITGNTPEEIDAAIALAKDKTARILQNVQAATQQTRQNQRGASVTAPPVGPMENDSNYKTLTAEDIRDMDMETYRQNREKILGSLRDQTQSQGLYG